MDQSTKHTGWSFWIDENLINYGVIDVDEDDPAFERMKNMSREIAALINKKRPDYVVIEQVQFQRNYKVYSQLSQLQGVIIQLLFERNIPFTLVEPTKWRAYDGIKGAKRKEQKEAAIQTIYNKYNIMVTEDTAEAIGIGLWAVNNIGG